MSFIRHQIWMFGVLKEIHSFNGKLRAARNALTPVHASYRKHGRCTHDQPQTLNSLHLSTLSDAPPFPKNRASLLMGWQYLSEKLHGCIRARTHGVQAVS